MKYIKEVKVVMPYHREEYRVGELSTIVTEGHFDKSDSIVSHISEYDDNGANGIFQPISYYKVEYENGNYKLIDKAVRCIVEFKEVD